MKHLVVTYDNQTLFDGDIEELVWSDSPNGVKIEGRVKAKPAGGGGGGLGGGILDMLSKASKAKTSQMADAKRGNYETVEPVEPVEPESGSVEESAGE